MDNQLINQIKKHIDENTVPVQSGRKCIDGRYLSTEFSGAIARPGGDFGYVMALLDVNFEKGLGLTSEEIADKVYNTISQISRPYHIHTDEHALHDPSLLIGCGHIVKSTLDSEYANYFSSAYNSAPEDVKKVLSVTEKHLSEDKIDILVLKGEHKEKGVLIVTGTKKTVNQCNGKEMYFVYDKTRDDAFIDQLVNELGIEGLTAEDLKRSSDKQLNATLELLAKDLPKFIVNVDEELQISPAGIV